MKLSAQAMPRAIETTNFSEIQDWCKKYHLKTIYPCDTLTRFGIGIYQIHQGMDWMGEIRSNAYEGFMSAVINFMIAAESLNLSTEEVFKYQDLKDIPNHSIDYRRLLYNISVAQQHFFYKVNSSKTGRENRRYHRISHLTSLCIVIEELIGQIDMKARAEAVWNSTKILSEELGK